MASLFVDEYSVSSVPIEMCFGETKLSQGTAFFWQLGSKVYLITNWHNVSGKNPTTGIHLSVHSAEPDSLIVWWNVRGKIGDKKAVKHYLRDADGRPLWLVHPYLRQKVDVVAFEVGVPPDLNPYCINTLSSGLLKVEIGNDVFILGFPYGVGPSGFPVWKRGSVATEPELSDNERPLVLVDTASRPGMSGSPIIRRTWGPALMEDGTMHFVQGGTTRFFGVYSGRLQSANPLDAELGLAWPARFVEEIVSRGIQDV